MTAAPKKKLIEVAIPLEAVNAASAREKSMRHGHPSTLHLWWARRPLAACRAVLFAQLVDDPSSHPDKFPTAEAVEAERNRLFKILEELVIWENSTKGEVLERARSEIRKSCDGELPTVYDPFSGGGSIPLEAQRLGLPAVGSDLNPVAVMIAKATVELPPIFKDRMPIHPGGRERNHYRNAEGLAEDVAFYGNRLREVAFDRIGHLYPRVNLPNGGDATAIAWLWARTVPSPDPALGGLPVPLIRSFNLSTKRGHEAWVEPVVSNGTYHFEIRSLRNGDKKGDLDGTIGRQGGICIVSRSAMPLRYVREQGRAGNMGARLMAIVAEGKHGRIFLAPCEEQEQIANSARPAERPEVPLPRNPRDFKTPNYGITTFSGLFTDRQLVALETLSELVQELRTQIENDARHAGLLADETPLCHGGHGAKAYAEAMSVYLAFLVDQIANHQSTICGWNSANAQMRSTFSRQAIPMIWDYAECNLFSQSSGSFHSLFTRLVKGFELLATSQVPAQISQVDAQSCDVPSDAIISTDPPYYDNIGYADLSDFFYIHLRQMLGDVYPELTGTLAVPKKDELVATPYRHDGKANAERFFLSGMSAAIKRLSQQSSDTFPATIYYAFKQSDIEQEGLASTGWATFIEAVISAGYSVVATWPVRTEKPGRTIAIGTNALASSVVIVCRKKASNAGSISRAEFIRALRSELPSAIAALQAANLAPADMPQSSIGPGMGIYSRYEAVLESDDSPMTVKTALQLINRELDEYFGIIEGEFDADTRFAITWFGQYGLQKGEFDAANSIAQARGISVRSVENAGIIESAASKVRILKRDELVPNWDPAADGHLTVWECCQHLIRKLEVDGEYEAALLLKRIGPAKADAVKDLAYCLYGICDKRGEAKEAASYNGLIAVWTELTRQAASSRDIAGDFQTAMDI